MQDKSVKIFSYTENWPKTLSIHKSLAASSTRLRHMEELKMQAGNFNERLIAAVARRSFIYDKNDPRHNLKKTRSQAWKEIADEMGCDEVICHTRWRSLKDTFMRKYAEYMGEKGLNEKGQKPSWPWFDSLFFLKDFRRNTTKMLEYSPLIDPEPLMEEITEKLEKDETCVVFEDTSIHNAVSTAATESGNGMLVIENGSSCCSQRRNKRKRSAGRDESYMDKLTRLIASFRNLEEPTKAGCFLQYIECELKSFSEEEAEEFFDNCTDVLRRIKHRKRTTSSAT